MVSGGNRGDKWEGKLLSYIVVYGHTYGEPRDAQLFIGNNLLFTQPNKQLL